MRKRYIGAAGFRQFGKDFTEWAKKEFVDKRVKEVLVKVLALVTREAMRRAPVETGNLRRSIGWKLTGATAGRASGAVGSDVEYAPYVEFGTRYIDVGTPAHPRTSWPAKAATAALGETMPFLRAAIYAKRTAVIKALKGVAR